MSEDNQDIKTSGDLGLHCSGFLEFENSVVEAHKGDVLSGWHPKLPIYYSQQLNCEIRIAEGTDGAAGRGVALVSSVFQHDGNFVLNRSNNAHTSYSQPSTGKPLQLQGHQEVAASLMRLGRQASASAGTVLPLYARELSAESKRSIGMPRTDSLVCAIHTPGALLSSPGFTTSTSFNCVSMLVVSFLSLTTAGVEEAEESQQTHISHSDYKVAAEALA